ncbi:MAG: hypothetical protein ABI579_05265 [Candidatus Sumerlaeota bacterium]
MIQKCHRFRIASKFQPADLFKLLKRACEIPAAKKATARFEFEWMKRKLELIADDEVAVRAAANWLLDEVKKKTNGEFLLPRPPEKRDDQSFVVVMGVLLQTPDVYVDMIVRLLEESGIAAIHDAEDNTLKVAVNPKTRALQYELVVTTFLLPPYLSIDDLGDGVKE